MASIIAVATDVDKRSVWRGHFGVAPYYSLFDENAILVKQIENPFAREKHHDNPHITANLLKEANVFIAKSMGEKSRQKLTKELGVKSFITDADNIYEAIDQYKDTQKNIDVFERLTDRYESWFEHKHAVYASELNMLKSILPSFKKGIEIGVGTGRFAGPLGIKEGVEPSEKMAKIAQKRGISVYPGFAESLPLPEETYDLVLIAVTICFVKDPVKTLNEAYKILKSGGHLVVVIVDKNSPMGQEYIEKKETSEFYRNVNFFSAAEIKEMLEKIGIKNIKTFQTLFGNSIKNINEPQDFKEGYGEGGFVAVLGEKP